jgi:hypothetical protein
MEEVTLPELPKPFHTFAMPWIGRGEPGPRKPFDYYTPDQLREYARVAVRMERERGPTDAQLEALAEFIFQEQGSPSTWSGFDFNGARAAMRAAAIRGEGGR